MYCIYQLNPSNHEWKHTEFTLKYKFSFFSQRSSLVSLGPLKWRLHVFVSYLSQFAVNRVYWIWIVFCCLVNCSFHLNSSVLSRLLLLLIVSRHIHTVYLTCLGLSKTHRETGHTELLHLNRWDYTHSGRYYIPVVMECRRGLLLCCWQCCLLETSGMRTAFALCCKSFHDAVQSQHDWTDAERKSSFKNKESWEIIQFWETTDWLNYTCGWTFEHLLLLTNTTITPITNPNNTPTLTVALIQNEERWWRVQITSQLSMAWK